MTRDRKLGGKEMSKKEMELKEYFINFGFKIISFIKYLRGLK